MKKNKKTEEKILDASLTLVSRNNSFDITVRDIAKEANVNLGAINYHFNTKEEMMNKVKLLYLSNTKRAYEPLANIKQSPLRRIFDFSNNVIVYSIQYPGVVNILDEAYKNRNNDKIFKEIVETTNFFNSELDKLIEKLFSHKDKEELSFKKNILLSSITYPAAHTDLMHLDPKVLSIEENRTKYIKYLLELLI